jgi:hypothetical protein
MEVVNESVVNERDSLRNDLLNELYDYNFKNNGKEKMVNVTDNPEIHVAYVYLFEKGLINYSYTAAGRERKITMPQAKITARGIDVVENEVSVKNV